MPKSIDLPAQHADTTGAGPAGPHGAHQIQFLQQLLQLHFWGQMGPVLWDEDVVHCQGEERTEMLKELPSTWERKGLHFFLECPGQ